MRFKPGDRVMRRYGTGGEVYCAQVGIVVRITPTRVIVQFPDQARTSSFCKYNLRCAPVAAGDLEGK